MIRHTNVEHMYAQLEIVHEPPSIVWTFTVHYKFGLLYRAVVWH